MIAGMDEPQAETAETAEAAASPDAWGGAPLRSTLKVLAVPGVVVAIVAVLGLPAWILYLFGAGFGLWLLPRILRDPEPLMAIAIAYLPLSKMYVIPMAPGLNGTNVLLALLIVCWLRQGRDDQAAEAPR